MPLFATIPAAVTRFILAKLHNALPPVPDHDPATIEARDVTALASIARLAPMNVAEAELAIHAIACEAHANDALQEAIRHYGDLKVKGQCRAQSALMIRQAAQVRKELRLMQEARLWAEYHRQQEEEAAEREAAEAAARADETTRAPFLRRLVRRQGGEARGQSSQNMGRSRMVHAHETESARIPGSGSGHEPDPAVFGGWRPCDAVRAGTPRRHLSGMRRVGAIR